MNRTLLLAALAIAAPAGAGAAMQAPADRPNVILIITDDLGYGDVTSFGAPDLRTPSIDRIGREGIRLTDFYSNAPLCTPTRAGLISGRYQQRSGLEVALGHGATPAYERGLAVTGTSLPQLLRNHGYATGLVGKWHLGYKPEVSPGAHGFDYFYGFKSGYIDYYTHTDGGGRPDFFENEEPITPEGYTTDLITGRSLDFIRRNAERPFFLEVAHAAGHWPYQPPGRPVKARGNASHLMAFDSATSTRADYVAMVEHADAGIGQILDLLDELRLTGRTLVIFTNDNGGEWLSRNAPFFHRKWSLWEGGIRVPTAIRWPGRIPAGRVSAQVGMTMDLTATILAATGAPVPPAARHDGVNLLPVFEGLAPEQERTLFWRTAAGGLNQRAVRRGDWKLLVDGPSTFLFNLKDDPGERHDLAAARPDVARALRPLLRAWEADVDPEGERPAGRVR